MFLALFADCLKTNTGGDWTFHAGHAGGLIENNRRLTKKRLDGFVRGVDPAGHIPELIACEVKGWNDNSKAGYKSPKRNRVGPKPKSRGEFYWEGLPAGFCRQQVNGRPGVFYKLDAEWNPPSDHSGGGPCAVGLLMYHLMEPPLDAAGVERALSDTRSVFWFYPPEFTIQERVLVFSVAQYLRERPSDVLELNDPLSDCKVESLRRLGVL